MKTRARLDDARGFASVLVGEERDGVAFHSSSSSPSNPMDVIL